MKKTLLALITTGLFAASASAATYFDINLDGVTLNASKTSHTGWFDIKLPFGLGYDPSTEYVYSASAEFQLLDFDFNAESLTISVGGSPLVSQGSFFAPLFPISIGGDIAGSTVLFDLSADGMVSYTINRTSGNFTLVSSILKVQAGNRVPDGGASLTLLGLALLGILGARRRFASVS